MIYQDPPSNKNFTRPSPRIIFNITQMQYIVSPDATKNHLLLRTSSRYRHSRRRTVLFFQWSLLQPPEEGTWAVCLLVSNTRDTSSTAAGLPPREILFSFRATRAQSASLLCPLLSRHRLYLTPNSRSSDFSSSAL